MESYKLVSFIVVLTDNNSAIKYTCTATVSTTSVEQFHNLNNIIKGDLQVFLLNLKDDEYIAYIFFRFKSLNWKCRNKMYVLNLRMDFPFPVSPLPAALSVLSL